MTWWEARFGEERIRLLEEAGLRVETTRGGFDGSSAGDDSPLLLPPASES